MTLPTFYATGLASVENGSTAITGVGTLWGGGAILAGDLFCDPAQPLVPPQRIALDPSNGAAVLAVPWPGADMVAAPYEIRFVGAIERSTAQTRRYLEMLGKVGKTGIQIGGFGAFADRPAYDDQKAEFVYLSLDGDGASLTQATLFIRETATEGVWSDGIELRGVGPAGPPPLIVVSATATLAPGSAASFVLTPNGLGTGYTLAVGLPAGRGPVNRGDYNPATAYVLDDTVQLNGSTYIALGPTTGHAPPSLPATSNAYWQLQAKAGADGLPGDGLFNKLYEVVKTADYAMLASDAGKLIAFNKPTPVTGSLPPIASAASQIYRVINIGAGSLTVDPNAAELVDGGASLVLPTGWAADIFPNAAGTEWRAFIYAPSTGFLRASNNLSELTNPVAARAVLKTHWETIVDETRAAVGSVDIADLGAYRKLRGSIFVRPSASGGGLDFFASSDNGATFYNSSGQYDLVINNGFNNSIASSIDATTSRMRVGMTGSVSSGGQDGAKIDFSIDRFNEGGAYAWVQGLNMAWATSGLMSTGSFHGRVTVAIALNAIRFKSSIGNITYADIFLEGLRS